MQQAARKRPENPVPDARRERKTYCVYNQTRECFLSFEVTVADTVFSRLKGLIGRLELRSEEGLWVVPSCGVHTWGLLFPLDIIYLDENYRVIHLIEYLPSFRIGPVKTEAETVLELPTHTIYSSQTEPGDELVICTAQEMESRLWRDGAVGMNGKVNRAMNHDRRKI